MNRQDFNQLALEEFGDTVQVGPLDLEQCNAFLAKAYERPRSATEPPRDPQSYAPLTPEDIEQYGEWAWCEVCPTCGEALASTFRWGLVHGKGSCSACHQADFRYYHRPREGMFPIMRYALVAF